MIRRIFPHKVGTSLALSDILNVVAPNQKYGWTWTGATGGGGAQNFLSYRGDTLMIDSAEQIHFDTQDSAYGDGNYIFRFKARAIDFAWRIPDSTGGKSLRLTYNTVAAPNRITLAKGNWKSQTADFTDSLEYMYDPDLWHVVQIVDSAGTLGIYFDGIKLDFFRTRSSSHYLSGLGSGGLGIGTRNSGMKISSMFVLH